MAVSEGLVPDLAGKEARERFGDFHGTNLIDMGISGFKLDECDNSDYTGGWSFPDPNIATPGTNYALRAVVTRYELFALPPSESL